MMQCYICNNYSLNHHREQMSENTNVAENSDKGWEYIPSNDNVEDVPKRRMLMSTDQHEKVTDNITAKGFGICTKKAQATLYGNT